MSEPLTRLLEVEAHTIIQYFTQLITKPNQFRTFESTAKLKTTTFKKMKTLFMYILDTQNS